MATGAAAALGVGGDLQLTEHPTVVTERDRDARRRGVDREHVHLRRLPNHRPSDRACDPPLDRPRHRPSARPRPPQPRHQHAPTTTRQWARTTWCARRRHHRLPHPARDGRRDDRAGNSPVTRSPHSTMAIDSPSSRSSHPTSCSSCTWSSRYTSACTIRRATREHGYSRTTVNVGLTTGVGDAEGMADALGEHGLAGAEVARQREHVTRAQEVGDARGEVERLSRRARDRHDDRHGTMTVMRTHAPARA